MAYFDSEVCLTCAQIGVLSALSQHCKGLLRAVPTSDLKCFHFLADEVGETFGLHLSFHYLYDCFAFFHVRAISLLVLFENNSFRLETFWFSSHGVLAGRLKQTAKPLVLSRILIGSNRIETWVWWPASGCSVKLRREYMPSSNCLYFFFSLVCSSSELRVAMVTQRNVE